MTRVYTVLARFQWKAAATIALLAVVVAAPWWAPYVLARLSFFRVRRVEVQGTRYLSPAAVLGRLRVDTGASVWGDLDILERRLAQHPQVRAVTVERRLPGTLVVRVTENLPVAFVPSPQGLRAVDAAGRPLPIDPTSDVVDLPVVARPDTAILRLLSDLRGRAPALFNRINHARRTGRDELVLAMPTVQVRATRDVSADRLADIIPVERDLARRRARAIELDLRFRDQVIARVQ